MQLSGLRLVDDREQVTTDTVHVRLDQSQDRVRRDRRVDGVATTVEDLRARLRRERLAGRDDAERRGDDGATGDGKGMARSVSGLSSSRLEPSARSKGASAR